MEIKRQQTDWFKYLYAFVITAAIFGTAIYLSNYFSNKKLGEIKSIEDKVSLDILSSETQFSLLAESSCENLKGDTVLSKEVSQLGDKVAYTEEKIGSDDTEFQSLKQYYSLLQIKDYLLMRKISEKCNTKPVFILYFYSNKGSCDDCQKEGYVLTRLRELYPLVRIYSFDYDFNSSAISTLTSIYKVQNNLPALIINDHVYYGLQDIEDIKKIIPELKKFDEQNASSTSKATSTKK